MLLPCNMQAAGVTQRCFSHPKWYLYQHHQCLYMSAVGQELCSVGKHAFCQAVEHETYSMLHLAGFIIF